MMYNEVIGMNRKCMNMLLIGMDLTIETDNNGVRKKYKSKVADLYEKKVCIYYPLGAVDSKPAFLPVDTKVMVEFARDSASFFSFESKVIGVQKSSVPLVELALPEEGLFNKVQRREYVRVNAAVSVALDFPSSDLKFTSVTSDISAGGCAVVLPLEVKIQPAEVGTIEFSIQMGSGEQLQLAFLCEVMRTFPKNELTLASLKYVDPPRADQQLLTRFCFERQLSDRKKGLYP